jgi:hypothetical protein
LFSLVAGLHGQLQGRVLQAPLSPHVVAVVDAP